jgi:hypothetical protein
MFRIESGTRITGANIRENLGDIVVYSSFRNEHIEKVSVPETWLVKRNVPIQGSACATINANSATVDKVLVIDQRYMPTDDVIVVNAVDSSVDLQFLAFQPRRAVAAGGFLSEAKLFAGRVRDVC